MGVRMRLRMALVKLARFAIRKSVGLVDKRPGLRRACVGVVNALGLRRLLKPMYSNLSRVPSAEPLRKLDPAMAELSERSAAAYKLLKQAAEKNKENP